MFFRPGALSGVCERYINDEDSHHNTQMIKQEFSNNLVDNDDDCTDNSANDNADTESNLPLKLGRAELLKLKLSF